jgi:DNA-binding Xre family transcriptional regulator
MAIVNRVPELLAKKFGGADKVVVLQVAQDLRLTYSTVERWAKNDITRVDLPILEAWCKYLGVGVGDILIYEPSPADE